jgi:hypothetical protein
MLLTHAVLVVDEDDYSHYSECQVPLHRGISLDTPTFFRPNQETIVQGHVWSRCAMDQHTEII